MSHISSPKARAFVFLRRNLKFRFQILLFEGTRFGNELVNLDSSFFVKAQLQCSAGSTDALYQFTGYCVNHLVKIGNPNFKARFLYRRLIEISICMNPKAQIDKQWRKINLLLSLEQTNPSHKHTFQQE